MVSVDSSYDCFDNQSHCFQDSNDQLFGHGSRLDDHLWHNCKSMAKVGDDDNCIDPCHYVLWIVVSFSIDRGGEY